MINVQNYLADSSASGSLQVYEVEVRVVPSVGDYSAVSWIIRILKKVSDTLNVTK
jgi:hypothetical protein